MNSYNKLQTNTDLIKYYKSVLADLKTKRFKNQNKSKNPFLDEEIEKLEKVIKEFEHINEID